MNEANLITDFVTALDSAREIDDCFTALSSAVESLGFRGVVYTSIIHHPAPPNGDGPIFLHSSGFDSAFLDHYAEAGFAGDDFTIKRILSGNLQLMDWWEEEHKALLLPAERTVIETAREEYGLTNGISIPTLSTKNQIAGASIVSDEHGRAYDLLIAERLESLKLIIRAFHNHVYANLHLQKVFYGHLLSRLSERERELLKFTAMGLPLKAYQDRYGTSPTAAGNHRSRLFRKLGVKNMAELTYIAGLLRLLEAI